MHAPRSVAVALLLTLVGCRLPSSKKDAAEQPTATSDEAETTPSSGEATIGGHPLGSVTPAQLVDAASKAGWSTIDGAAADLAVLVRESEGRQSMTVAFEKGGTALTVMIVRPTPGKAPSDGSMITDAKTTVLAFGKDASYLDGETCVVVSARIGIGENPSKASKLELLDALLLRAK